MIGRQDGPLGRVRNIGIMAHIDAGKTTTTERILFYTGRTHRMGAVDDGDAEMDWMDLERERGITITSAATFCTWRGHQINIIDTPGHVDFTAEVERSLRVLDGAVAIFCAVAGVQPQSEAVWRQADRYRVPRVVFINKMDRAGARFEEVVQEIRDSLGANALPVQAPLVDNGTFVGVVDLVRGRALSWDEESLGARYRVGAIPREIGATLAARREELIDRLSQADDALLEEYLERGGASEEGILAALRRATLERKVFPVLCGASLRNQGVQPLLDAVVDLLPSPSDTPAARAVERGTGETVECPADGARPLAALAFKVAGDQHAGRLTYLRVYSGRLRAGETVYNATRDIEEKVLRLLRMHANRREDVGEAVAGDIVAATGFRRTATGDTLCDRGRPVLLEAIVFPEPMVSQVLEPKSRADQDRLAGGMARLEDEDPTFRSRLDGETGQVVVSGMGELHLDVVVERLYREFGVRVTVGSPNVAYRETIAASAEAEVRLDRSSRGGKYAHVLMRLEPGPPGSGFSFESRFPDASLPEPYVRSACAGAEQAAASGTLAGYPVVDLRVILCGGSHREGDSSEDAFAVAGALAFRDAMARAQPLLLEPAMVVEAIVPEESFGEVLAQLTGKQAVIEGVEARDGRMHVRAFAALRTMLGYARELRSASSGRGTYTMQVGGYRPVPSDVRESVVRRARGELA